MSETKKDDIFKKIFSDKEIFLMLLKDFVKEDWTKDLTEVNLKLEPTLFPDGVENNRESDIIYRVKYDDKEAFVFVLLEHQSKVNYLMIFRVLEYMVKLWRKYIDEVGKRSQNKDFMLPPIYPIVFYDGIYNWTSPRELKDKILDNEKFQKNIPNFRYEMINLKEIGFEELELFEDLLSILLIIDKIKKPEELKELKKLKREYWEKLKSNVNTRRGLEKIAEAVKLLLMRINTPDKEVAEIVEEIYEGRLEKMFEMAVEYDVQAERAKYRAEGMQEGIEEGMEKGIEEGMEKGIKKEKRIIAKSLIINGLEEKMISVVTGLSIEEVSDIKNKMKA